MSGCKWLNDDDDDDDDRTFHTDTFIKCRKMNWQTSFFTMSLVKVSSIQTKTSVSRSCYCLIQDDLLNCTSMCKSAKLTTLVSIKYRL